MRILKFYQFYKNGILQLHFINGETKRIRLTKDSGRIVTRKKVNTVSSVNHPGIFVGKDILTSEDYILHNHYKLFKTAGISNFREYASGQKVHWDNRPCKNSPLKILEIGLQHMLRREQYYWLDYNCQTTVNDACNNSRTSEDIRKWISRIAFGVAACLIVPKVVKAFSS